MSKLYPVAGSRLYIGGPITLKDPMTAADFAGQEWTEVDGWANAGQLGDTQEFIEQSLINRGRTLAAKGLRNGGQMDNVFVPMALDPGQAKFKEAIDNRCDNYAFKVEWGADCVPTATVTISQDDPGVVTWNGHGLLAGQPVVFETTGQLPTGLTAGQVYYVIAAGLTADTFSVSTEPSGTAVDTTGSGATGVHTASAPPTGMTDLFAGLAAPGPRAGGDATAAHTRTWSIRVNSNIVEV